MGEIITVKTLVVSTAFSFWLLSCSINKNIPVALTRGYSFEYVDSIGTMYVPNPTEYKAVPPFDVLFTEAIFNPKTGEIFVTGLTIIGIEASDTLFAGCIKYFLAEPVNDTLRNIYWLGESTKNGKEGSFSFRRKISRGQRLYFTDGLGTAEYKFEEILY